MIENLPLPSNPEAERFMLHVLMDEDEPELLPRLNKQHFSTEAHRILFETIGECFSRYGHTERATICNLLREMAALEAVGGLGYVVGLADGCHTSPSPKRTWASLNDTGSAANSYGSGNGAMIPHSSARSTLPRSNNNFWQA